MAVRFADLSPKAQRQVRAKAAIKRHAAPSKYHNKRVEHDGAVFDSKRELKRWLVLRVLERSGSIRNLQRQVAYPISIDGLLICKYVADFVYEAQRRGNHDGVPVIEWVRVVEDAKGMRTREYLLKKKLMKAIHRVVVMET